MSKPPYHARTHAPNAPDPIPAVYEIKIFSDTDAVTTGNSAFVFAIPRDCGGTYLREAAAFVTTTGSDITRVQIRNVTESVDMLESAFRIEIDSGEFTSYTAVDPPVIDTSGTPPNNRVSQGDLIAIDVDDAGTGALGLGVMLQFGPQLSRLTPAS